MRTHHPGKTPGTDQTRRTATPALRLHAAVRRSAVDNVPRSPGQPLTAPLTQEMAIRPGADFSRVRVHTESVARASAAEARARAYTSGSHTVIGDGGSDEHTLALQRSIGNAAMSRLLEQARHQHSTGAGHQQTAPAPVQRSTVHDVLSSSGQPLRGALKEEMEARLGADFSDVRVHTNVAARASATEVGARAYTSGSDVVIGPGPAGKHTLAHELTHVIQQRQGPVAGTDDGSGLSLSDPSDRFERAAEANSVRVMSGSGPRPQAAPPAAADTGAGGVMQRAPIDETRKSATPVQRIMTEAEWRPDTEAVGTTRRNQITEVDSAVREYWAAGGYSVTKPGVSDTRVTKLKKIIAAGRAYTAGKPFPLLAKTNERLSAVHTLVKQAEAELPLLQSLIAQRLVAVRGESDLEKKLKELVEVRSAAEVQADRGLCTGAIRTFAAELINELVKTTAQQDVSQLTSVSQDTEAPRIVPEVIEEALKHISKIHFGGGGQKSEVRLSKEEELKGGMTQKYVLGQQLVAPSGKQERLASLMHEMTHVVASETYQNTMLFLLFDPKAQEDDVVELASGRRDALHELLDLTAAALQGLVIDDDQASLLRNKLEYGGGGPTGAKLRSYLGSFAAQLDPAQRARLLQLTTRIESYSSTVIEYDSVINQVLLLCHQWNLEKNNPLYAKVLELATAAKASRDAQREKMEAETEKPKEVSVSGAGSSTRSD